MTEGEAPIDVTYRFLRAGRSPQELSVRIDSVSLRSEPGEDAPYPGWTRLDAAPCEGCAWAESDYCPVAVRLVRPLRMFRDAVSYEPVRVEVETQERHYRHDTDMQQGLSSLFGLLMATSGCPSMAVFRPMARYHLPFATFEETFFRISGTYLLRELLDGAEDIDRDSVVRGLNGIYRQATAVNASVMERLRRADGGMGDSSPNAVALLAAVSGLVPLTAERQLEGIARLFR